MSQSETLQSGLLPAAKGETVISDQMPGKKNTGFICLHRSIQEHWIWDDPIKLKWWLDILMLVNHSGAKVNIGNQLIDCNRGQSVKSVGTWAKRWRVDSGKVRRFFKLLESDGMIVTENVFKTTRLTVCNYGSYNDLQQDNSKKATRSRQHRGEITATNNNDNHVNHVNKRGEIDFLLEEYKTLNKGKRELLEFIDARAPQFIEPYVDLWNLFAKEKDWHTLQKITKARKQALADRLKESEFNFTKILTKGICSDFICKDTWFDFDWIIKGENKDGTVNYIKVLEGKYDNKQPHILPQTTQAGSDPLATLKKLS